MFYKFYSKNVKGRWDKFKSNTNNEDFQNIEGDAPSKHTFIQFLN